ncbi:MAG: lipoyl(octanoyl) transferase LipB [Francisellaceae bacterium]
MNLQIKHLGIGDYDNVYHEMVEHTEKRDENSPDSLWLVEHPPVFTQGRHGRAEHLINPHAIPVVQSDRGGQITYHGPGQAIIYFLLDLKHFSIGIKTLVCQIEKACMDLLESYGIDSHLIDNAPGIYVQNKKIASLGLRVKKGRTYHGIAINTDMDLTPFSYINPCGYQGLKMTQIADFRDDIKVSDVFDDYSRCFVKRLKQASRIPSSLMRGGIISPLS